MWEIELEVVAFNEHSLCSKEDTFLCPFNKLTNKFFFYDIYKNNWIFI